MTSSQIIDKAHREQLAKELETLGAWCLARAKGLEHSPETTLTLLERKASRVRGNMMRAGWEALAESNKN
jgi:uncharacterized protein (DUF2344 family)